MDQAIAVGAQNLFSLAHPEFYEPLSRYAISSEYTDRLVALLPDGWLLQRNEVWMHAHPPEPAGGRGLPTPQGFKIHVSSAPEHALRVLELVVPICAQNATSFKIAADSVLLHILNSKLQGRGYSGKFMTIYPGSEGEFRILIETLYQLTRDEPVAGPYILSDRRYKDSALLYYRYGGFYPPHRLNIDGTMTSYLVSPAGGLAKDERQPFFQLPNWVDDPFESGPPESGPTNESERDALLHGRYLIEGVVGFSNAGGVYHGVDTTTGAPVILKEARPYTNCWTIGNRSWHAVYLLEREHEVLSRLDGLNFVPRAIECFTEWEHTFLVEERIDGQTLDVYWAQEDVILAPYVRWPGTIERFVEKFIPIARELIDVVEAVHGRGVILGDLSPRNVLIDPLSLKLTLIDFESAALGDDDPEVLAYALEWGTAGFIDPKRAGRGRLTPVDDYYALGMTLFGAVVPANNFFALNPDAQTVFLDEFIALGVPQEVRTVVNCLLSGEVAGARQVLARWSSDR